ncbi:nucleolar protein 9, partial [Lecanoromycetidae sp. Uapishka_2]
MPKEHKKRGRREENKKRKREGEEEDFNDSVSKRQKSQEANGEVGDVLNKSDHGRQEEYIPIGHDEVGQEEEFITHTGPGDLPFYGLLDEDEQEYFKRADSMLELNQFADAEERDLFLANVYKEASGKELKIANSQSCSRLMERLIMLSTPDQLKSLFQKLSGQ